MRVSITEDNSLPSPGRVIANWGGEDITKSGDGIARASERLPRATLLDFGVSGELCPQLVSLSLEFLHETLELRQLPERNPQALWDVGWLACGWPPASKPRDGLLLSGLLLPREPTCPPQKPHLPWLPPPPDGLPQLSSGLVRGTTPCLRCDPEQASPVLGTWPSSMQPEDQDTLGLTRLVGTAASNFVTRARAFQRAVSGSTGARGGCCGRRSGCVLRPLGGFGPVLVHFAAGGRGPRITCNHPSGTGTEVHPLFCNEKEHDDVTDVCEGWTQVLKKV